MELLDDQCFQTLCFLFNTFLCRFCPENSKRKEIRNQNGFRPFSPRRGIAFRRHIVATPRAAMLAAYAGAAAVPGGAHAPERVGMSPTTPGGSGSRPANEQSASPELQKDLRLRVQQDHPVDIIISDRDRFVLVDNVKAASTTLRELLSKHLNVTWWDGCDGVYRQCCSTLGRTTTACLDEQHASYFVFGFARHPAVKFESGVPVVGCVLASDGASRAGLPMAGVAACPFPRVSARLPACPPALECPGSLPRS